MVQQIQEKVHRFLCSEKNKTREWFLKELEKNQIPFWSSYDVRDAGFKIANVDANIYPAGFNNICPKDHRHSTELAGNFLRKKYGANLQRIALVTEEHTGNPHYWDNVAAIRSILESAGFRVLVGFPRLGRESWTMQAASGVQIPVTSLNPSNPAFKDFSPEIVLSNNDFSNPLDEWAQQIHVPIEPSRHLGWYQRKKSRYFFHYNQLVEEFCKLCGWDPFLFNVETEEFTNFDLADEDRMGALANQVDKLIEKLRVKYEHHRVDQKPVIFIKNNSGTYGLAVLRVESGQELMELNSKARKKMKAAKGGREVTDVVVQEGIPSRVTDDNKTAEPVIYMIGSELAGGFLRVHQEKGPTESLNSPGAVFKKLCVADLVVKMEGLPLENVYGWSARLGLLAIGRESRELT